MMIARIALATALLGTLATGCTKEEGEGGKAAIEGRVYAVEYDNNTGNVVDSFYLAEARVYIIYGDGATYDDDTRTGPDGLYRFEWLRKGSYTLFTYSECPLCPGDVEEVRTTVEIEGKKDEVQAPVLRVQVWN